MRQNYVLKHLKISYMLRNHKSNTIVLVNVDKNHLIFSKQTIHTIGKYRTEL